MIFDLARWLCESPKAVQVIYPATQSPVSETGVPRGFHYHLESEVLDWAIKGYANDFNLNTDTYLQSRHVFETNSSYIGFGPSWMKRGDQVVMFDGGVTPFIIRKTITKENNDDGTWELVGDCYLHHWMHGNYAGHTVVDQLPRTSMTQAMWRMWKTWKSGKDEKPKLLVRECFTLI